MSDHTPAELVMDGLEVAIGRRRPKSSLVLHFDRRVQYAAHAFRGLLLRHGIVCSASGKGSCSDAAVKETFSHTLIPICAITSTAARAPSPALASLGLLRPNPPPLTLADCSPEEFEARLVAV